MLKRVWATALAAVIGAGFPAPASAADQTAYAVQTTVLAYAVTDSSELIRFGTEAPGIPQVIGPITGLSGDLIVGIDFRPATGELYALAVEIGTFAAKLYTVDEITAAATSVGAVGMTITSDDIGFDFNPATDRIRVVTPDDKNVRINPVTGSLVASDSDINPGDEDIIASAYAPGSPSTLYGIGFKGDNLYLQGGVNGSPSPNTGTISTVGALGVDVGARAGFDIAPNGTAYAALASNQPTSGFYQIDLATGAATLIGQIAGRPITAIAVTGLQNLVRFPTSSPADAVLIGDITGKPPLDWIVGADFRPANGKLYGLGSASRLYTVDTSTATATVVGSASAFALSGNSFGFDFSPVADRIRVVSNTGQNIRLNPDTGALAATDTDLNPGDPNVSAIAYTPGTSTTLFGIDSETDSLVLQGGAGGSPSPNTGLVAMVGLLGVDTTDAIGFDVANDGSAFAVLDIPGNSPVLHAVDLITGAAARIGAIPEGGIVNAFAIAPAPAPSPGSGSVAGDGALPITGLPVAAIAVTGSLFALAGAWILLVTRRGGRDADATTQRRSSAA